MKNIFNLSLREIFVSRRRLSLPGLALVIAVASLFILRGFQTQIEEKLYSEGRAQLGGDISIRSFESIPETQREAWERALPPRAASVLRLEFNTMLQIPARDLSQFVQLSVIETGYPLYGNLKTSKDFEFKDLDQKSPALLMPESLATLLNLSVGSQVRLGELEFKIGGLIYSNEGSLPSFLSFAPTIYIHRRHLEATKLLERPGRVRSEFLVRLPGEADQAVVLKALEESTPSTNFRVQGFQDSRRGFQRIFEQVTLFAQLISVAALLLSGFSVYGAFHNWLYRRRSLVAMLRTLGANRNQVTIFLLSAVFVFSVVCSLLGLTLGYLGFRALHPFLTSLLQFDVSSVVPLSHFSFCFSVGLLTPFAFSLFALSDLNRFKPLLLIRSDLIGEVASRMKFLYGAVLVLLIWGFTAILMKSMKEALVLSLGILGVVAFGFLLNLGLFRLLKKTAGFSWTIQYALKTLLREKSITLVGANLFFLLSFILGAMIYLESSLQREFRVEERVQQTGLFIFDVGEDERKAIESKLAKVSGVETLWAPWIRLRWKTLNDLPIESETRDDEGRVTTEYLVSESLQLSAQERIVSGRFWSEAYTPGSQLPEVSLTREFARRFKIKLGDRLGFELFGVPFAAQVTNFRIVRWSDFEPGFRILFQKGIFEGLPFSYLGAVSASSSENRYAARRILNTELPAVSVVDVSEVKANLSRILKDLGIALFSVLGFLLLLGIALMAVVTQEKISMRWKDFATLRCLGAEVGWLRQLLVFEMGIIAFIPAIFGLGLGLLLGRFLLDYYFALDHLSFSPLALAVPFATLFLVSIVAWIGSRQLRFIRPKEVFQDIDALV